MILHLLLWLLLGSSCFFTGHFILVVLRLDSLFPRAYDRFFLALWLGIAILAPLFLAASIFTALTPAVGGVVFAVAIGLSLSHRANVVVVKSCLQEIKPAGFAGTVLIALGAALCSTQIITHYDTGLYHLQAIKWLAEYGTVPGIALIHERLGFASAWFALAGPLDHGFLKGQVYSFLGGFAFCTMIHALGVNLSRIAANKAEVEDVFLAVAFLLSAPSILFWRMAVSSSPDVPVIVLTIIIAWIYMIAARVAPSDGPVNIHLLPLILALGAVTIKLSALPLALLAGLVFCWGGGPRLRRLAMAGCAGVVFLAPYMAVNTIASGYPLFPSALLYLDLPWTLDINLVRNLEAIVQEWARWGGPTPVWGTGGNWIQPWIMKNVLFSVGVIVSFGIFSAIWLRKSRLLGRVCEAPATALQFYVKTMIVAIAGLAFSVFKAPDLRFGLGYVVIIPALIFAIFINSRSKAGKLFPSCTLMNMPTVGLGAVLILSLHVYCFQVPQYTRLEAVLPGGRVQAHEISYVNFIWPPPVLRHVKKGTGKGGGIIAYDSLDYIYDTIDSLSYYRPKQDEADQCWDAPLPCAPEKLANVRLRDPQVGLAAGFVGGP